MVIRIEGLAVFEGRPFELLATNDVHVEVRNGLERVFAIVDHSAIALLETNFGGNFSYSEHHVTQKCFISVLFNILQRSEFLCLGKDNKVSFCHWIVVIKCQALIIFVKDCHPVPASLEDLVKGRVSDCTLFNFDFVVVVCLLFFGNPFADGKLRRGGTEITRNDVSVPVHEVQVLSKFSAQGVRLDGEVNRHGLVTLLGQFNEVGNFAHVVFEGLLTGGADRRVAAVRVVIDLVVGAQIQNCKVSLHLNFVVHSLLVTQSLVVHTLGEQLVEVKVVFRQKLDVR